MEVISGSGIQHPEMNKRVLMAGKTDVTNLSRAPGFHHGFDCAVCAENSVRIFQSDDLVELHQVNSIRLQPFQGFVDLLGGGFFGAAVALGHEESPFPVTVSQSFPHADFADTVIVVPAVVHEGDALVNGAADNRYARSFVRLFAYVKSAQSNG